MTLLAFSKKGAVAGTKSTPTYWPLPQFGVMPPKRRSHGAVLLTLSINEHERTCASNSLELLIVFGGFTDRVSDDLFYYCFDFEGTGLWGVVEVPGGGQSIPPRSRFLMWSHQNRIFVYGGWDGEYFFNDFWKLEIDFVGRTPETRALHVRGHWEEITSVGKSGPGPRGQGSVVVTEGGLMLMFGGNSGREPHNDLWGYYLSNP